MTRLPLDDSAGRLALPVAAGKGSLPA